MATQYYPNTQVNIRMMEDVMKNLTSTFKPTAQIAKQMGFNHHQPEYTRLSLALNYLCFNRHKIVRKNDDKFRVASWRVLQPGEVWKSDNRYTHVNKPGGESIKTQQQKIIRDDAKRKERDETLRCHRIFLTEQQKRKIDILSARTGITRSEIFKNALDKYLADVIDDPLFEKKVKAMMDKLGFSRTQAIACLQVTYGVE